jgi:hypothetical protein
MILPYTPLDKQEHNTSEEDIVLDVAPSSTRLGLTGAYGQVISSKRETAYVLRKYIEKEGTPTFGNSGVFRSVFERENPGHRVSHELLDAVVRSMGRELK